MVEKDGMESGIDAAIRIKQDYGVCLDEGSDVKDVDLGKSIASC